MIGENDIGNGCCCIDTINVASIVSHIPVRSSVHTYPIIEITVALNAHRVSLMHRNR
jgi:hypothetical protein